MCATKYEGLRFESLHDVIKGVKMECLERGKRCLAQGKRFTTSALVHALNEARMGKEGALNEAQVIE